MSRRNDKPPPRMLPTVLETISNLREPNGSHVRGIMGWIRANTDFKPGPTLSTQIKRALKHGERSGVIVRKVNRYRLNTEQVPTPTLDKKGKEVAVPESKNLIKTSKKPENGCDEEPSDARRRRRRRRGRGRRGRRSRSRSRGRRRRRRRRGRGRGGRRRQDIDDTEEDECDNSSALVDKHSERSGSPSPDDDVDEDAQVNPNNPSTSRPTESQDEENDTQVIYHKNNNNR